MINWTNVALALWLVLAGTWIYFHFKPQQQPVGAHVVAAPAAEVKREAKVAVRMTTIETYRPTVKKKLSLPEPVQRDSAQHVVSSVTTPNDERRHTVTTVVNAETGKVDTYDRAEPLPWVSPSTKTEVGVFYGVKNGVDVVRLHAQQELLQVKALHLGAVASADFNGTSTDTFVGVGVWARW